MSLALIWILNDLIYFPNWDPFPFKWVFTLLAPRECQVTIKEYSRSITKSQKVADVNARCLVSTLQLRKEPWYQIPYIFTD